MLIKHFIIFIIIIDVIETPIQRPKKTKTKEILFREKEKDTIKSQVIIEKKSTSIIETNFAFGKKHDFRLFEESKVPILKSTEVIVDTGGYQGLQKIHSNVLIPNKKSKKKPLTKEQKHTNREISKVRIVIENVFAILKKFKIITEKYRNRRKRFALRFNIIVSIYN